MFWDKFSGRKRKPFYQNSKYQAEDWLSNYQPRKNPYRKSSKDYRKTLYRLTVAMVILTILVAVRQIQHPLGQEVRDNLRYVLTTEWNFQPAIAKVVQLGTQLAGMDHNFNNDIPPGSTAPVITRPGSVVNNERMMPVSGKVVRGFGYSRDPLDGLDRFHPGVDIAVDIGTPVQAVKSGRVMRIGEDAGLGKYVLLEHGQGAYTLYAGLTGILVSEGQRVEVRQKLGDVGGKGDVPGGGLHFEVREKANLVDPLTVLEMPKN